jgi:hypothetical protein
LREDAVSDVIGDALSPRVLTGGSTANNTGFARSRHAVPMRQGQTTPSSRRSQISTKANKQGGNAMPSSVVTGLTGASESMNRIGFLKGQRSASAQ